jgi:hypothetical protein
VKLWAIATGKVSLALKAAAPLAFSPNGKLLATGCSEFSYKDGTVRLW